MSALPQRVDEDRASTRSRLEEPETLAGLLLRAARRHPACGVSWITGPDGAQVFLSYPALLEQARGLLGGLRARGARAGDRIALLLERPEDFIPAFWASLLGGFLCCPLAPIRNDPKRWEKHLAHVNSLLEGPLLVTTTALKQEAAGLTVVDLADLRTRVPDLPAQPWEGVAPDDPALLMLTSGSTGDSKAVTLTHANLLAALDGKAQRQGLTSVDVTLNWISFDHVAALIEAHLLPLYVGATQLHVMPGEILADPLLFLRLIDRARVSMTFAPNFLFGQINLALRLAREQGRELALDLSCVRRIISGGEAIVVETGRQLLENLVPYGLNRHALWPAFGMTETCAGSVYSSEFPDADTGHEHACLGTALRGLQMRIADERGDGVCPGEVGELQLRGPMVFGGYYNNLEATRAAFTADGWFRSGDLGRIVDGRLSLVGRAKDSIIVSGVNYYSHELEAAVTELPGIERGYVAAFPFRPRGADTEQLAVAFTPAVGLDDEAVIDQLMIEVRNVTVLLWGFRPAMIMAMPQEAFPKTSLGKIQRSLMRQRLEAGQLVMHIPPLAERRAAERAPPQGPIEAAISEIFDDIFGCSVSATESFFDLGGTSLEIFRLKRSLERHFHLADLPLVMILQNPTVRALAVHIFRASSPAAHPPGHDPLVPLQLTGSKLPLFCVHPGSGEVLVLVQLASCFAGDRPFYALRARGLGAGEPPYGTFQEMVSDYTGAIRRCQPHGPYALAGYSYGAPVAFEIAKALESQGERVAFLGSLDGTAYLGDTRLDAIDCAVILAFFLSLIDRQQLRELPGELRHAGEQVYAHLLDLAPRARLRELDLDLDLKRFRAWAQLSHALVQLGASYVPSGTVESVTVFHAEPLMGTKADWLRELRRWDRLSRTPTRYIPVDGEHHTLLELRHVDGLHAAMRAELDRVTGGR